MYANNIFFLKDWETDKFLQLIITIQTLFISLIILEQIGVNIPILKELIGLFIVLFIPGTLFLRILNLDGITSKGQILLCTVGSSLVLFMVIGFLMNYLYPIFGMDKPLSSLSILLTFNIFIFVLCYLSYFIDIRRKNKFLTEKVDVKKLVSSPILILFIVPIISILGTYLMNIYQYNGLTIIMICLICLIAYMVSLNNFIPSKYYPLIVFIISISIILHKSLITNYIWGWDINSEYFLVKQVITNSFWNENLPMSYNSMLSVMVLAPILSSFIDVGLVWIMKIVYPFIFSLVPLGLYYVFREQTTPKVAFFSTFLFVILFTFHTEMLTLIRQQVAELMLVLVLLLIVSDQIVVTKKYFLAVLFGMAIIVAHYGLTYILTIILLLSAVYLYLDDNNSIKMIINRYKVKIHKLTAVAIILQPFNHHPQNTSVGHELKDERTSNLSKRIEKYRNYKPDRIITPSFLILFIFFLFSWYIYTSSSSIFQGSMFIGQNIIDNLYSLLDPNVTQGLSLVMGQQATPLRNFHKYIYLISQFFIFIGILALFLNKDGMNFKKEYKAISLATFVILVAGLLLPFFSSQMNTTRLYHIALIILSPFFVLGIKKLLDLFKGSRLNLSETHQFKLIAIFLILFLLFDSGIVYEFLDKGHPTSIALSSSYDFPKFNQRETTGGEWLAQQYNNYGYQHNITVYADKNRAVILSSMLKTEEIPYYFDLITANSYLFLGTLNLERGEVYTYKMEGDNQITEEKYQSLQANLKSRSKIYDNGGSYIYGPANR